MPGSVFGEAAVVADPVEIGAEAGMWSFQRYLGWLEKRTNWFVPRSNDAAINDMKSYLHSVPASPVLRM